MAATRFAMVALFSCLVALACNGAQEAAKDNLPEAVALKLDLARTAGLEELEASPPIRRTSMGEAGLPGRPTSFAYLEDGRVVLVDNKQHALWQIPPGEFQMQPLLGECEQGKLEFPHKVYVHKGRIYVSDNDGINVFDGEGCFVRLIRPFIGIFDFVVDDEGFYISPMLGKQAEPKPLIIVLDRQGTRIRSLGERGLSRSFNYPSLAGTPKYILVAFRYRPLVRIYRKEDGTLVNEVPITHPLFPDLMPYTEGHEAKPGVVTGQYGLVFDIAATAKGFRVLLDFPFIEIVEYDFSGCEPQRLRFMDQATAASYFGIESFRDRLGIGLRDLRGRATFMEFSAPQTSD